MEYEKEVCCILLGTELSEFSELFIEGQEMKLMMIKLLNKGVSNASAGIERD